MMKIPFVKEWGSWAVFVSSTLAALIAGLMTRPWESGRDFSGVTLSSIFGLSFLINSKNPLASLLRNSRERWGHIAWFLFFSLGGLALMIPFFIEGISYFYLFSGLVISYSVLLSRGLEHNIFAELNGFALLAASAPVVYFAVTGEFSIKLYLAVFIFFAAGVLKVRVRIKKNLLYRWVMASYCVFAVLVFDLLGIPVVLLVPLTENIVSVVLMREEKLKATGYTELLKGVAFIVLIAISDGSWMLIQN